MLSATTARQRRRSADQEAVGKAEQGKNTEARQRKRAANQEAGDKAERGRTPKRGRGSAPRLGRKKNGNPALGFSQPALYKIPLNIRF